MWYIKHIAIMVKTTQKYVDLALNAFREGNVNKAISISDNALEKGISSPDLFCNLGIFLKFKGNFKASERAFVEALKLAPNNPSVNLFLGMFYYDTGFAQPAYKYLLKSYELNPKQTNILNTLFLLSRLLMDYKVSKRIGKLLNNTDYEEPLISLYKDEDFKKNLLVAKIRSESIARSIKHRINAGYRIKKKIRVGYLSYDFRLHPMAQLISGLFENHDKKKFDIYAYSTGPNDKSIWRGKIQKSVSKFIDVYGLSDEELSEKIAKDSVDVLVDLSGHTSGSRQRVMHTRPAPIIVNLLGFAGSMGSTVHDYIIADKHVIKKHEEKYFTENIVYMPDTYYPTNDKWKASKRKINKEDYGLPNNKFIFASFVQTLKIDEDIFKTWMQILTKVPNSVLWLLKQNKDTESSILKLARRYKISPVRILCSDELSKMDHLNRLKLADLLLDSGVYGGHTTTVDGLWMGVPTISIYGKHFASRAPASILRANNLSELVVTNKKEYVRLAVNLARNKKKLGGIKKQILKNNFKEALFDTKKYTRNLESTYAKMIENYLRGKKDTIYI
jgi:protein O-GlcNAc transferase